MKSNTLGTAALVAAALILSGCAHDISKTTPTEAPAVEVLAEKTTEETTVTTAKVTTTKKTTTSAAETETSPTEEETEETTASETASESETKAAASEADTTAPAADTTGSIYSDEYKSYVFGDTYKAFLNDCVFVGDSICSGLKAYDIIPADRVVAVGNVAARNIFEDWVEFKVNGGKYPLIPALAELKPKYIVFSMGMNDVNMTSEQDFCKNYEKILSQTESILPDAKLIVLSVTPITYSETGKLFTTNANIDSFNKALKEYLDSTGKWIYCDVAHEMKNTSNMLKANYLGSADGVHLAPDAYNAILYQLCERMVDGRVYNFDGSFNTVAPSVTEAAVTTAETTTKKKKTAATEDNGEPSLSGVLVLDDPD